MRFSIAAGILAVSIPSNAHVDRNDKIKASSNREGLRGGFKTPYEDGRTIKGFGQRKLGNRRRATKKKRRGLLLKNDDVDVDNKKTDKARGKECKLASFDVDVGVLGCGFGHYCQESAASKLGGVCVPSSTISPGVGSSVGRNLEEHYYLDDDFYYDGGYDDDFYYGGHDDDFYYGGHLLSYCDDPQCDCSDFDNATYTGTIGCGPVYECYEGCDSSFCFSYTNTINVLGVYNYTQSYCLSYESEPYDRTLCVSYDYKTYYDYGEIVEGFIGGVKCDNFTYSGSSYSYGDSCFFFFDCTNTPANIASSSCDDGVSFLPEAFYDYSNCTDSSPNVYRCNPCGVGSYITIPDGMVEGYTCEEIELSAHYGLIGPDNCPLLTPSFEANCGCELAPTPENDLCMGAIPLEVNSGELVMGTNKGASMEEVDGCYYFGESVQGVWYTITGDGASTIVSLCEGVTNFDTEIQVFKGSSCNDLVCIGRNDDAYHVEGCDAASAFDWFAEADTVYYLLVHGFNGEVGDFTISSIPAPTSSPTMTASPTVSPPDNDMCDGAVLLGSNDGQLVVGSTVGATPDEVPSCYYDGMESVVGVWYELMGTGEDTSVNLRESHYRHYTVAAIFEGSCGDLFCIGLGSEYSWFAEAGTTYYILVHSYFDDAADFVIISPLTTESPTAGPTMTASPTETPPENNHCEEATELKLNSGEMVMGTTVGASMDDIPSCYYDGVTSHQGVWYTVSGGDAWTSINLCEGTTFDTVVIVLEGDSCGDLVCIGENDDGRNYRSCGLGSEYSWFAESGKTYYVFVTGLGYREVGNFGIRSLMTTPAPTPSPSTTWSPTISLLVPENDDCDSALPLELNGEALMGSTTAAGFDEGPLCLTPSSDFFLGVWYTLTADTDTDVIVHLCDEGTSFDTRITVYEGSCGRGSLVCVDENDDRLDTNLRCGLSSAVGWKALAGEMYYIAVHGFDFGSRGDFVIQAEEGVLHNDFSNVVTCPDMGPLDFCNCASDCEEDSISSRCQCEEALECCDSALRAEVEAEALATEEPTASPTTAPSAAPTDEPTTSPSESPTPEPKFSFVVSNISEDEDWCLTATRTKDHGNMGFRPCDYDGKPDNQLFKHDNSDQLVSKIDEARCVQVGFGTSIFRGVRVRLGYCDTSLTEFWYDPEGKYIRPQGGMGDLCITNQGESPDSGDTIQVLDCEDRGDFHWDFVVVEEDD